MQLLEKKNKKKKTDSAKLRSTPTKKKIKNKKLAPKLSEDA